MLKNLFLLGLLTWVSMTYAKTPVAHETMAEAETFKVEQAAPEQKAQRGVAGSKIKKKTAEDKSEPETVSELDSEVRYWKYSEE